MESKKILFLTGTRADFGKLKPLIDKVVEDKSFESYIFATGMHTLAKYGKTVNEIYKSGYKNIFEYLNQRIGDPMDLVLANTIDGLSRYIHESPPDMIVIHGDRVEALAGAIVGALNNIYVAHIEGGEVSGTIDESIRHSVSKLSHLHFVANNEAKLRLVQLGEEEKNIFVIGSPDIDVMLSNKLPDLLQVKQHYGINFQNYAIVLFHPVTTEVDLLRQQSLDMVNALVKSNRNYVVIYPNNDEGSEVILQEYSRLNEYDRFKLFPSIRFEWFLRLLKHADFIIGNSSVGIREAPVYAVNSINIGTRQQNRYMYGTITNVGFQCEQILKAIREVDESSCEEPSMYFGVGDSADRFHRVLVDSDIWTVSKQKVFRDIH